MEDPVIVELTSDPGIVSAFTTSLPRCPRVHEIPYPRRHVVSPASGMGPP